MRNNEEKYFNTAKELHFFHRLNELKAAINVLASLKSHFDLLDYVIHGGVNNEQFDTMVSILNDIDFLKKSFGDELKIIDKRIKEEMNNDEK